jgi:glycosyltransferase involved in cell wall biosynthesis
MGKNKGTSKYIIITPARNEEKYMVGLIESMIVQNQLPQKWVIVNDASSDKTGEIVESYLESHPWIELIHMPEKRDRSFAAKVDCFDAGYEKVKDLDYEVIGNVDADVSFEKDYMGFLMDKFVDMPNLGVAGTPFVEDDGYNSIDDSFEGSKHVAGGCQLFRKKCFEEIGGYKPNKAGGIDWIAVTTARMMGWKTQSFPEKVFYHHRSLGTGESNKISSFFNYGRKDYYLGNHPLWELIRILYRCTKNPVLVGSLVTFSGYLTALVTRMERPVSRNLMKFHRKEEMHKLKSILGHALRLKKYNKFDMD